MSFATNKKRFWKSIVEALLGHETAGYPESKKSTLEERTTTHLINSYKEMIEKHGASEKEEVSKVGELIKEFKDESKPETKSPSSSGKAPKLPKSFMTLWGKAGKLTEIGSRYVDGAEDLTRHGLAIHIALGAKDKDKDGKFFDELTEMVPTPHEAPKSFDSFKDMHHLELAYRAKVMGVKDWDKLAIRSLKAKLPEAYSVTPVDSHVVKTVKPVEKPVKVEGKKVPAPTKEQPIPKSNRQIIRGQDSFMNRYVPPDKTVKSYYNEVGEKIEFHAKKNNLTVEEYKSKLNEKCQDLIDKCDLKMRIDSKVLLNFILHNGGRFKNQFETGTSGGYLGKGFDNPRAKCETSYWDIHKEADGATRPIYGYMYSDEAFDGKGPGWVDGYGDLSITFKPDVKKRTTVGTGDTLNNHFSKGDTDFIVKPVTEIDHTIIGRGKFGSLADPLKAKSLYDLKDEYIEAQIFGPTTVHDIAHVSFAGGIPNSEITKELDKLGIPWHKGKKGE